MELLIDLGRERVVDFEHDRYDDVDEDEYDDYPEGHEKQMDVPVVSRQFTEHIDNYVPIINDHLLE